MQITYLKNCLSSVYILSRHSVSIINVFPVGFHLVPLWISTENRNKLKKIINMNRKMCLIAVRNSELFRIDSKKLQPLGPCNIFMRIQCNIAALHAPRKFHCEWLQVATLTKICFMQTLIILVLHACNIF